MEKQFSFSEKILEIASRKQIIAVIGGGVCSDEIGELAEEVGKQIAIREGLLVCGGLFGVMEACCRGAKAAGGVTIGILPGSSIDDANDFVDIPIPTGMGIARNSIIAHTGRAAVAVDGKFGTLSEIGYFLQLDKPVIGIRTWDIPGIISVEKPKTAVEKVFSILL